MNFRPVLLFALALLLCSCANLYDTGITITKVMDSAAKDYAHEYNKGVVPPQVHAKVQDAWGAYVRASKVAADMLEASKVGGTQDTVSILIMVRNVADKFLEAITPYIAPVEAQTLQGQLAQANKLK